MKRADKKRNRWSVPDTRGMARARLRDLIDQERRRAQFHISLIRQGEPKASSDRIADVMFERWKKVSSVEGGVTGALGFAGVPLNLVLSLYCQIALIVSIAEAYDTPLDGQPGEDALLDVLGRAHGIDDFVKSSPRVLGALARSIALRRGFGTLGRLVPFVASPIAAKLNERAMHRLGLEALRRFGNVVRLETR